MGVDSELIRDFPILSLSFQVANEGRKWAAQQAENHLAETHEIKEQRKVE